MTHPRQTAVDPTRCSPPRGIPAELSSESVGEASTPVSLTISSEPSPPSASDVPDTRRTNAAQTAERISEIVGPDAPRVAVPPQRVVERSVFANSGSRAARHLPYVLEGFRRSLGRRTLAGCSRFDRGYNGGSAARNRARDGTDSRRAPRRVGRRSVGSDPTRTRPSPSHRDLDGRNARTVLGVCRGCLERIGRFHSAPRRPRSNRRGATRGGHGTAHQRSAKRSRRATLPTCDRRHRVPFLNRVSNLANS